MSYYQQKNFMPIFNVGRYNPALDKLDAYFLENKNPLDADLEVLAKEINLSIGEIKQYYEQLKLKDISAQNIQQLKEGRGTTSGFDVKKPKFTVMTSLSPSSSSNVNAGNDNEDSQLHMNKKVSKSITEGHNPQLETEHDIKGFLSTMESSKSLESRKNLVKILVDTHDKLLNEFSTNKLLTIISEWIHDCKDTYNDETPKKVTLIETLVNQIILLCQRMTITYSELKRTKIGKNINKFGKLCSGELKEACLELVQKWKNMIDNYSKQQEKDNNKTSDNNNSDDDYLLNRKTKRVNDYHDHNYYTNESTTQSISMNKKAKHDEYKREESSRNSSNRNKTQITGTRRYMSQNGGMNTYHYSNKIPVPASQVNTNQSAFQPNKPPLKKGGLKKNGNQKKKIHVTFESESKLEKVKIFKMTDQPNGPEISDEEYERIQKEVALNPHIYKLEEIRQKEIKMDKPREPQTKWQKPKTLKLEYLNELHGKYSKEKIEIEDLCQRVLSVTYFNEIPEPKEGPKELFPYEDENIPKIENVKIEPTVTNIQQEDSIKDIMNYIESLQGKVMTTESFNEINTRLNNIKDISQEQKNNIKGLLSAKMSKVDNIPTNHPTQNFPSPITPIPFNFPNYNMNINMNMNFQQQLQPQLKPPQLHPQTQPQAIPQSYNYMEQNKRMMAEPSNSKMNLQKYKTKPCRNYHSSVGCNRDINCYFIHDTNFKGVDIPNFNYNNYEKKVCPVLLQIGSEPSKSIPFPEKESEKPNEMNIPIAHQQTPNQVPPYPYVRPPMMPMNYMYMNPYYRPMMVNPNQKDMMPPQQNSMMKLDSPNINNNYPMGMNKNNQ